MSSPTLLTENRPSLRAHLAIARFDHWVKNVFVLPGVVAALALTGTRPTWGLLVKLGIGLLATGFVASSNYVINEVLDAPFDRTHPIKKNRPVPSGKVHIGLAYVQWIAFAVVGLALAWLVNAPLFWTLVVLWIMGCVYNIPPVRSKDVPYLDVLSEAINNPIRLLAGWFIASATTAAPGSLLLSYWMVGCYFMGLKRYSELRRLHRAGTAADYRKSIAFFTPERMLIAIVFYASAAMLFFGAFLMRYKMELVLSFPFIAWVMASYLSIAFTEDSAAENPEKLYKEKSLMAAVVVCAIVMSVLFFADLQRFQDYFAPTAPTQPHKEVR